MEFNAHEHILEAASSGASKAIASGTVVAVYGGFTATEIAAFGGLAVAIIGLFWKLYVDHQILKIARQRQISEENFQRDELEVIRNQHP
ncbi:MAG: holin [Patescibacteria group bacterium]|nr:holin [Patescibacteria group bacterium]